MKILHLLVLSCFVTGYLCQRKCLKKADIAFVVDSSSSIWYLNFVRQRRFLYDILSPFDISPTKTQVAAVSYSNFIRPEFQFNTYKDKTSVLGATQNITQTNGDATRTYKALEYMNDQIFTSQNGARNDAIKIAIVTTDGETNPGSYDRYSKEEGKKMTLLQAQRAKDNGVYVFAVGVGKDVNDQELLGIASGPESVIKVNTYEELRENELQNKLIDWTCEAGEKTTLPPVPPNVQCEKKKADIIFAIDQSSSIGDDKQFRIELDFVNSLIKELDVASDQTRIGAVVFSTNSERRLELRDGINRETVIDTIQKFEYGTGDTYIGKAFADMREGFLPAKGGRPGLVPQIAVLITDGEATDQNTKAKPEADKLRNSGVEIFAIGVKGANRKQLERYASRPSNVFFVDDLNALNTISGAVLTELCE
uniref:VWFA domain-containing protein n=3 Tax=Magallana gigas TaxID=29159 RepID=A0A8W8KJ78_MAGGI|nr:collagen alpha-1(XII) chain [Crassostrea gigas]